MKLYYDNILLGYVTTNHSMSIEDALVILDIDMDKYAADRGWDDWEYEKLRMDWTDNLISLSEYAQMHGITQDAVKKKCQRGGYMTARKIGRNWVIDKDEPYEDNRIKSGKYINWRK